MNDEVPFAVRRGALIDRAVAVLSQLARAVFARYGLEFPPRVEGERVAFYQHEWPM